MSDYPRPSLPGPAQPYPPDRIVALVFAALFFLSEIFWFLGLLRRPGAAADIQRWWWYYLINLAFVSLYAWVFLNYARSRFWAFMTMLVFACLASLSNVLQHRIVYSVVGLALVIYSVSRLLGILGPRPLRRVDVIHG